MFGRKRTHLIERAVERLAQSGELDESAAHLLETDQPTRPIVTQPLAASMSTAGVQPDAVARAHSGPPNEDVADGDIRDVALGGSEAIALMEREAAAAELTTPPDPHQPVPGPTYDAVDQVAVHAAVAETRPGRALEEPGPHTLIPREGGAGQPFVDMTSLFRAGMIDWNRVRSRVSEEFRLVQRQIVRTAFTAAGAEPGFSNLLLITSSIPGEGKSFTSLNLAACIARQRDHHVLLIDIDSKRDSFCMALGLGDAPGLLDLAANPELDAAQVMAKTAIENLSVLPIGIERDLGPELFASKQMTKLIQTIGRRYADRLIVLDAPPTLSTSDPAALAPIVGQVLFVVEAERTQRDEVVSSLDLLQACPTITLLLNKVQVQTRYTFGAYSTYYTS
jgi:protein-tyrosine kinase